MKTLNELTQEISVLGRAEYRYDCLVSDFANHYLELQSFEYQPLPDISVLRGWEEIAGLFGFALGDHVKIDSTEVYAVRMSAYPRENIVRVLGFSVKKDGKAGQTSIEVELKKKSKVAKLNRSLSRETLEPLFFEGCSRLDRVKGFLRDEVAKLS